MKNVRGVLFAAAVLALSMISADFVADGRIRTNWHGQSGFGRTKNASDDGRRGTLDYYCPETPE